jgi:hypothetical protein
MLSLQLAFVDAAIGPRASATPLCLVSCPATDTQFDTLTGSTTTTTGLLRCLYATFKPISVNFSLIANTTDTTESQPLLPSFAITTWWVCF